jgi:hypothetical protein
MRLHKIDSLMRLLKLNEVMVIYALYDMLLFEWLERIYIAL